MSLALKIVGILALIMLSLWALTHAFDMVNTPNTALVVVGIVGLLAILAVWIAVVPKIYRSLRRASRRRSRMWSRGPRALSLFTVFLAATLFSSGCMKRVDAGYVGIKVNMAGSQRGVADLPLTTGWVGYNPFGTHVFQYPTFVQTAKWTRDPNEGRPLNEEITFTTKDSMVVSADISLSYLLVPEKVPHFYVKFRNDDLETFTHGFLRNLARDHFNEAGGKYAIEQVMGDNEPFIREVRKRLQADLDPIGVKLEQFGFIGAPRPPQVVVDAINAKVQATQLAFQKQNEIVQVEAEAKKRVAQAEGEAQAKVKAATGEAEANRILVQSITPQLIQWRQLGITEQAIARWNGQRPMVEGAGGSGLLLQVPMPSGSQK